MHFNVISLGCNNTNVAEYDHLLSVYLQVCVYIILGYSVCYITFIYAMHMLRVWPPLLQLALLSGIIVHTWY